jgi:hypothetical protein
MIHKATAKCSRGHSVEFGPCNKETSKYVFFKTVCTSLEHEVLSRNEVQCKKCKTIHMARPCPKCSEYVPVEKFKLQSEFDRMMKSANR